MWALVEDNTITKIINKDPIRILKKTSAIVSNEIKSMNIKKTLLAWAEENEISIGIIMQTFRIALIGKLTGPDLFKVVDILGKDVVLKRIEETINYIDKK